MLFDRLIACVVLLFVVRGAWRGALLSLLALLSLVVVSAAAIVGATRFGTLVAGTFGAPPMLAAPLGGAAGFVTGFALMSFVGLFVRRADGAQRAKRRGKRRGAGDRALGALCGGLRGLVMVGLIAALGQSLEGARFSEPAKRIQRLLAERRSEAVSRDESGGLLDALGPWTERLLEDAEIVRQLQSGNPLELLMQPRIPGLAGLRSTTPPAREGEGATAEQAGWASR